MKANEAPEKIYLNPALDALTEALSEKTKDDIEYTRTDAFIEKAKKWFNSKNGIVITDTKALFEEFIDYVGIE